MARINGQRGVCQTGTEWQFQDKVANELCLLCELRDEIGAVDAETCDEAMIERRVYPDSDDEYADSDSDGNRDEGGDGEGEGEGEDENEKETQEAKHGDEDTDQDEDRDQDGGVSLNVQGDEEEAKAEEAKSEEAEKPKKDGGAEVSLRCVPRQPVDDDSLPTPRGTIGRSRRVSMCLMS